MRDIGRAAAAPLLDPHAVDGDAVGIAGDDGTLDQAAQLVHEVTGAPARFVALPLEALDSDPDTQAMLRWFAETPACRADRAATRRLVPDVLDLRHWPMPHPTAPHRSTGGCARLRTQPPLPHLERMKTRALVTRQAIRSDARSARGAHRSGSSGTHRIRRST